MRTKFLILKFLCGFGVGFGIGTAASVLLLGLAYAALHGMLG